MFIKFETAPFIQSYRSSHLVFVVFTKLCKEPLFSASERRLLTVSDYTPQKNEAEVLQQHSCRVICLFRSSTAVQPWLHLHSSFSPLSTSRSTHPYNDYSHHVKKQQDTPSLIRNLVFCSALRDAFASLVAILHSDPPEPISQSALSCSHPSLRPIPHLPQVTRLICSCSSRTHSNVEVQLFTPGISDPWEACCVPQMLFLIYLGMWVLMLHSSWIFQSSSSCHVSCPSVSTVEAGWGEPILGLNPLLSTSEMKQGWRDSRWIKERSVLKCCNMFSDPCRQWLLKAADVTCLGCKVNMIDS